MEENKSSCINSNKQHTIRAIYTEHTIRVHQAYNNAIAQQAVSLGNRT